jgi:Na+/phosphate symporter
MAMTLPRLTPDSLRTGILEMTGIAIEMLGQAREAFLQYSPSAAEQVAVLGRDLHLREKRLTDHVAMQLREMPWSLGSYERLAFLPAALERVGDSIELLVRCIGGMHRDGVPFSEKATTEILTLFGRGAVMLEEVSGALRAGDRDAIPRIQAAGTAFQTLCDEAALHHQERMIQGVCTPRASSLYLAMLDDLREIERYVRRMTVDIEKALPPAGASEAVA